jgi:hydroxymethylbilane synthase
LRRACPAVRFEVQVIRTAGDANTGQLPARFLGKGFFTKEIEDALLAGTIDLAVHSLKDLPTDWAAGLALGAIPPREDPRDALVGLTLADLAAKPAGVRIGTSSLRRAAQLRRRFPACRVENLRGNLDTRLRKVKDGTVDCAVLAAAGLRRLGRAAEIRHLFAGEEMLPAPGQGALAVEIRAADTGVRRVARTLHCSDTDACVTAERAFMRRLGGGCQVPVAALATVDGSGLRLHGRVVSLDGGRMLEGVEGGAREQASALGERLAAALLAQGAGEIVREIERALQEEQNHA